MTTPLRIGFDARLSGARHAGIGRYSSELLRCLLTTDKLPGTNYPIEWVVWGNHEDQLSEFPATVETHLTSIRHYGVAEQLWGLELQRAKLDLLHVPHFNVPLSYRKPFVVTIHDLLWHTQRSAQATTLPAWQYAFKSWAYRVVSESAIRRAERVLVPSQVVAQEVAEHSGRQSGVIVTSEGLGKAFLNVPLVASPSVPSAHPTLFYVGSLYPHKNMRVVLQALQRLPQWSLRVASSRSVFVDRFLSEARSLGVADQVTWLGACSDQELITELQTATIAIQPSQSEGFGLTVLEGLAVGATVLTSDIPIFREVGGEHIHTFAVHSPESCAKACEALAQTPPDHAAKQAAQQHARSYTWQKAAQHTLVAYRDALRLSL